MGVAFESLGVELGVARQGARLIDGDGGHEFSSVNERCRLPPLPRTLQLGLSCFSAGLCGCKGSDTISASRLGDTPAVCFNLIILGSRGDATGCMIGAGMGGALATRWLLGTGGAAK